MSNVLERMCITLPPWQTGHIQTISTHNREQIKIYTPKNGPAKLKLKLTVAYLIKCDFDIILQSRHYHKYSATY